MYYKIWIQIIVIKSIIAAFWGKHGIVTNIKYNNKWFEKNKIYICNLCKTQTLLNHFANVL